MPNISQQLSKFKELIEKSDRILVTSHISPDPDSICSTLLLGTTLQANYPNKQITIHAEESAENLDFLSSYQKIQNIPLTEAIENKDLIVMVDAMNFVRCSRNNAVEVAKKVKDQKIPLAIIDHHQPVDIEENTAYINDGYPAAVQQVYETCFNQLNLQKPEGYAETTMTGLYSDTNGFAYLNDKYKDSLRLIEDVLDAGVKIEEVKNKLNQYNLNQLKALAEFASNATYEQNYSYTFLSDNFVEDWIKDGKPITDLHMGLKTFTDSYIRNIEGRNCGVTVYRDPRLGDNYYSVSFRSVGGNPDMSVIAQKFGGGGHKGAAGSKIPGSSVEEVISKIKSALSESGL